MKFGAVSIGTTRTQFGVFDGSSLHDRQVVVNDDTSAFEASLDQVLDTLADEDEVVLAVASVNKSMLETLKTLVIKAGSDANLVRIEKDIVAPIGRQVDPDTIVGEDRLLNAAAAFHVLKQACVIVDAGTALTVDFVDGAGTFHGGAIAPGAQLMLDALHQKAGHLPAITFTAPEAVIGHNTRDAMLTATFHGIRGMVRELVEQFAEIAGGYPAVIATGGDAETLFADYELIERIVPELTLLGIESAMRRAGQDDDHDGDADLQIGGAAGE